MMIYLNSCASGRFGTVRPSQPGYYIHLLISNQSTVSDSIAKTATMSSLLNDLLDGTEDIFQLGKKGFTHARNEVIGILYPSPLTYCDNIFHLAGRLNPNRKSIERESRSFSHREFQADTIPLKRSRKIRFANRLMIVTVFRALRLKETLMSSNGLELHCAIHCSRI